MAHEMGERLDRAIAKARSLAPHELMPRRDDDDTPITAARFLSLYSIGGAEDFFSSDLEDRARAQLRALRGPVAFLISGSDEHVPAHVDKTRLLGDLVHAVGLLGRPAWGRSEVIAGASHSIEDDSARARFMDIVLAFLDDLDK